MATLTPPAPKSFDFFYKARDVAAAEQPCEFALLGALPFCTSEPHSSSEFSLCSFDEPVAPPMPSRPVRGRPAQQDYIARGRGFATHVVGA